MERREHPRHPIRLRVTFKSIYSLINEFTISVSKGGCSIFSVDAVEVGKTFVFELASERNARRSVEVEGRVVHCTPRKRGGYDVGLKFSSLSSPRRVAVTRFLDEVFAEELLNRHHARVPVNLIARDPGDSERQYLVHDLSRGGMGLRFPSPRGLPLPLEIGNLVEITVRHDGEVPFAMTASVAWLRPGSSPHAQVSAGLRFEDLSEANQRLVDALLYLHRPEVIFLRFLRPSAEAGGERPRCRPGSF
jgi:c-di-GMP-binding flagellar brake protein YcgR